MIFVAFTFENPETLGIQFSSLLTSEANASVRILTINILVTSTLATIIVATYIVATSILATGIIATNIQRII